MSDAMRTVLNPYRSESEDISYTKGGTSLQREIRKLIAKSYYKKRNLIYPHGEYRALFFSDKESKLSFAYACKYEFDFGDNKHVIGHYNFTTFKKCLFYKLGSYKVVDIKPSLLTRLYAFCFFRYRKFQLFKVSCNAFKQKRLKAKEEKRKAKQKASDSKAKKEDEAMNIVARLNDEQKQAS